jgi:hypothetical protein
MRPYLPKCTLCRTCLWVCEWDPVPASLASVGKGLHSDTRQTAACLFRQAHHLHVCVHCDIHSAVCIWETGTYHKVGPACYSRNNSTYRTCLHYLHSCHTRPSFHLILIVEKIFYQSWTAEQSSHRILASLFVMTWIQVSCAVISIGLTISVWVAKIVFAIIRL